jgi:hypothetical protein
MMWPARAAIRPVPGYAVVSESIIEDVESDFATEDDLEERVDRAFAQLDTEQPVVARFLATEVDTLADETAQAVGHYLGVAVHQSFVRAFRDRLREVGAPAIEHARASYDADEELRRGAPDEVIESDDVVAIAQPALVSFVRQQLDAVLEPDEDGDGSDVDVESIAKVYRAILVAIMALSDAVTAPAGAARSHYLA